MSSRACEYGGKLCFFLLYAGEMELQSLVVVWGRFHLCETPAVAWLFCTSFCHLVVTISFSGVLLAFWPSFPCYALIPLNI